MYRVTAVAVAVFDAHLAIDPMLAGRNDLITACLLHDMGNIIKFDLIKFPAPDGETAHWLAVQETMRTKYGTSETAATEAIIRELGLYEKVAPVLQHTSDAHALELEKEGTLLQKIACYADQRVAPRGIVPLADRLRDMRTRYGHSDDESTRALDAATMRIEAFLFETLTITPEDITDESVARTISVLKSFDISPL